MKKKRLFFGIVISVILAVATCIPALADMIWEPNDSFYQESYKNCIQNGRSYTAEGADGTVTVFREPGSTEKVAEVLNGSEFYVSFTYRDTNKEKWGVVQFSVDVSGNAIPEYMNEGQTGWVHMTDLELIYDYISFAEDHQSEFKPYLGTYEEFKTADKITFWSYPGSGVVASETDAPKIEEYFIISDTYTNDEGRMWGFVQYYYGLKNIWVCFDDIAGDSLEREQPSSPENTSQQTASDIVTPVFSENETTNTSNQTSVLLLIASIVVAVVVVTGVMIAVFWKKNSKKDSAGE